MRTPTLKPAKFLPDVAKPQTLACRSLPAVPPPAQADLPADGRHEGRICVATRGQAPDCGAVQLLWFKGRLQVDVGDISYLLWLKDGRLDLVLQHGATQVDAFEAAYHWLGASLHFVDAACSVRYELCFGATCRLKSAQ